MIYRFMIYRRLQFLSPASLLFLAALVFIAAGLVHSAQAQTAEVQSSQAQSSQAQVAPAEALLSPADFLGYELGERFTRHERVLAYARHVAEHSERVEIEPYGKSYEGRALILLYVSTPGNLVRRADIRTSNLRRAGLSADGVTPRAAAMDSDVAIVWLSYNVHGNESVSSEASMQTLYDLARETHPSSGTWLENTLVIMDPMINPDGRDRYVNWYNRMVGMHVDATPGAIEHNETWPGGRTNHYFFDLNRDWSWLTQTETRQRMARYREWLPQVHVDFHEQGVDSPYYFAPAAEPYHPVITDWQREFQQVIGRNHASYFDANGWLYFTRQVFDLYYPGYGDTFPIYNGAIGMTYEQGGSGRAGLAVETAEGDTLRLSDRIAGHYTTGMSTVEVASRYADELLAQFSAFFAGTSPATAHKSQSDGAAAWLVRSAGSGEALDALTRHLDGLGILYGHPSRAGERVDATAWRSGENARVELHERDIIVPADQPRRVLARVLFERTSALPDSLTYDITAWALPYVYDLDAFSLARGAAVDLAPSSVSTGTARKTATRADVAPPGTYAWYFEGDDPAFLAELLRRGIRVRYNTEPITLGGDVFPRGTLIVTRRGNEAFGGKLHGMLAEIAAAHEEAATFSATGMVDKGPDLGSGDVRYIEAPRIAMPFGSPASSASAGQLWHYFDEVIGYPVTRMEPNDFKGADLSTWDVIVLPSGSWSTVWNEEGLGALRDWVRAGGRLVAFGGAASWLAGKEGFALKEVKKVETPEDSVRAERAAAKRYADRERDGLTTDNPGAIFEVAVDGTHPLGYGFGETSWMLSRQGSGHEVMLDGSAWNVGILGRRVSGHIGYRAEERVDGTLSFGAESMGRGSVVYLLDDPLYRAFWYSGRRLVANALFLVGQ